MRLKLFVFPSAIIIAISFLIAYVVPAYQTMQEKSAQLTEEQQKLANINEKINNFSALSSSMASNAPLVNGVREYLPVSRFEDGIVNMVGGVISGAGASVLDLQIVSDKKNKQAPKPAEKDMASSESLDKQPLHVNVKIVGSYDAIKGILAKLSRLSRGNMLENVAIESQTAQAGQQQSQSPNGNILVLDVTSDFAYAPLAKLPSGQIAQIFSQKSLDFKSIANRSIETMTLIVPEQSGKANPFIP